MILTVIVIASIFTSQPATTMDADITNLQWKKRLLLIFAADNAQSNFQSLANEISSRQADVDDRDLVVLEILESGTSRMNRSRIEPQKGASIRKQLGIAPDEFTVILVGKDGGIKLKRNDQVRLEEIFQLIDSMPMRQDEMSQNSYRGRKSQAGLPFDNTFHLPLNF
jgi:bifunctional DNA-binding transcriptional regulator/antitoxin component of YhaV-PrlF toxin-antitoxin module